MSREDTKSMVVSTARWPIPARISLALAKPALLLQRFLPQEALFAKRQPYNGITSFELRHDTDR